MIDLDQLRADIERDEGRRLKIYKDGLGIETIGIGRNLRDKGISNAEADFLFQNDISDTIAEMGRLVPWWQKLPEPAARALADMIFDLDSRILQFEHMLAALQRGDGRGAAAEVIASKFAQQTGARAQRIAFLFRSAFPS